MLTSTEQDSVTNTDHQFSVTNSGQNVVDEIHVETGISKSRIKDAMTKGAVWMTRNGKTRRIRRAKSRVEPGDELAIYYSEKILSDVPPEPKLIEDRNQYSVWYKPAGLLSSGSRYGDHCAINRWIEKAWQKPVFLVHRLDRFATGLIVVAHGKHAAAQLSRQFKDRETIKIYRVIVRGSPETDFTISQELDGKEAISHVRRLASHEGTSLLSVKIETGRKHQIRRHLADAGFPVLGDRQYGDGSYPQLQLCAVGLGFNCPDTGEAVYWELPSHYHPDIEGVKIRDHVS
jgi:tRNA pseudouridine32 synthase/23S rRNA pseudouridine746 synthase